MIDVQSYMGREAGRLALAGGVSVLSAGSRESTTSI